MTDEQLRIITLGKLINSHVFECNKCQEFYIFDDATNTLVCNQCASLIRNSREGWNPKEKWAMKVISPKKL